LKEQEQKDSTLTPRQQIDRLLRPGSTYLNLNPYEVLRLDPDTCDVEAARKKFKRLSLLVHPDRNADDRDRANRAFDILKKSLAQLEDPDEVAKCKDCYVEAKARLNIIMGEKRRKLKREGKEPKIEEDEPAGYQKALWAVVTKVFADREKKRKQLEDRANEEKKRAAEEAQAAVEKRRREEEFSKNYEESRDDRRGSWRSFVTKKDKRHQKGKEIRGAVFKPPKNKISGEYGKV